MHGISNRIGDFATSLFRLSLLRQVFQGAAASLFLKPSQSALLYSQTCLGGGVSDSGEASSRA